MTEVRPDRVFTFGDQLSFLIPHDWVEADEEADHYLYHAPKLRYESGENIVVAWEEISQENGASICNYWWAVAHSQGTSLGYGGALLLHGASPVDRRL